MTDQQVMEILGDLVIAAKIKIPMLIVFGVLGIGLLVAGTCCLRKIEIQEVEHTSYASLERLSIVNEISYHNGLQTRSTEGGDNSTASKHN